jgi:hypothetical protein
MTTTEAIVIVFAMFFFIVFVGILSHHVLERHRLKHGYYDDKQAPVSSPVPYN